MPVSLKRAREILATCRPSCAKDARPAGQSYRACLSACSRSMRKAPAVEPVEACPKPGPISALLAAGGVPDLTRIGKRGRWALAGPDGILATYKSEENARRALVRAGCALPRAGLCGTAAERKAAVVITPQGRDRASYGIIDAKDLVPSHNPVTFTPDARYPANVQERGYHSDINEQLKVKMGAQKLDPDIILHRAPTPTDGPPMVTEDGCVLGGNGRSMMLKRAYATGEPGASAYRESLACKAAEFGLTPEEVRAVPEPVLVRIVRGLRCDSPKTDLAKAVRRYNEALTNALDTMALAVSQSRQLSQNTIQMFGQLLSGDTTLREQMTEQPSWFLRALESDGIVTAQNRTKYATPNGQLTDMAKDEIEAMFLGRVLGSADRIRSTPPALLRKIEKAVPYLTRVDARNPSYSQTQAVVQAVDLLNDAAGRGQSLEGVLAQQGMFGTGPTGDRTTVQLARMLSQSGTNQTRDRFKSWAQASDFDPSQGILGGKPPTPAAALEELVGDVRADRRSRPLFSGAVVQQPGGLARIVEVGGSRDSRLAAGKLRVEYMTGQRRGERAIIASSEAGELAG